MINQLSESEKTDQWKLLFDGKTKTGWHIFNNNSNGNAWKVIDDCLMLDPEHFVDYKTVGGGDLVTDELYDSFHFKVDWKLEVGGNSGLLFWVQEEPEYECSWHTGPEMQLLDNANHKDGLIDKRKAGDLYDLIASYPQVVRPAGAWNSSELIVKDNRVAFRMNDADILQTIVGDESWKLLVAGSKFKDLLPFAAKSTGRIVLQDHRNKVWFRNIKIKRL